MDQDETDEPAVTGIRRTTLAARLKAVYGIDDRSSLAEVIERNTDVTVSGDVFAAA